MSYGILLLRVVAGTTLVAHGAQKLFGWFGGHGRRGTAGFFGSLGFRPPLAMALAAGLSESCGLLFAIGLLTPFAALAIASVMVVAVGSVHWKNGFWAGNGGYEYNLLIWTVAVSVAAVGPGRFGRPRTRLRGQPVGPLVGRRRARRLARGRPARARDPRDSAGAGGGRRGAHP